VAPSSFDGSPIKLFIRQTTEKSIRMDPRSKRKRKRGSISIPFVTSDEQIRTSKWGDNSTGQWLVFTLPVSADPDSIPSLIIGAY